MMKRQRSDVTTGSPVKRYGVGGSLVEVLVALVILSFSSVAFFEHKKIDFGEKKKEKTI